MALIVPDEGELWMMNVIYNSFASLHLRLYNDSATFSNAATLSSVSSYECSFSGYAAVTLGTADFNAPSTNGSNKAETSTSAAHDFAADSGIAAPETCRYYAIDDGSFILWYEQLSVDFTFTNNGDTLSVTPLLTLCTETGN